jgi:uncharacterized DUF497 family protein
MRLVFEWNARKAGANLRKHGVSFAEAISVFSDPLARIFVDEAHSPRNGERSSSAIQRNGSSFWYVSSSPLKIGFESLARAAPPEWNSTIMKNTSSVKAESKRRAICHPSTGSITRRPGPTGLRNDSPRIGGRAARPDVARVFQSAESVNTVLRALMTTMPARRASQSR